MPRTSHIVIAIVLSVAFYGLVVAVVAGACWVIYDSFTGPTPHVGASIFAGVLGFSMLRSAVPGWGSSKISAPELTRHSHPRLFALLREVADAMHQPMPTRVFLVGDANAFVMHRGGWLGMGGKIEFGIGLPMLAVLTGRELQSVFAHELGHFRAGDARLGAWIGRVRYGMIHIISLRFASFLHWPFRTYAKLFLRVTQSLSRQQELEADGYAARLLGADVCTNALKTIQETSELFPVYLTNHYFIMLNAGLRPPMVEGFHDFLKSPLGNEARSALRDAAISEPASPFDSHPPFAERTAALKAAQTEPPVLTDGSNELAVDLLEDLAGLEKRIVHDLTGGAPMYATDWDSGAQAMLTSLWNAVAFDECLKLPGTTVASFGSLRSSPDDLADQLNIEANDDIGPEERRAQATWILGALLAHRLVNNGFSVQARPGYDTILHKDDHRVMPFGQREDESCDAATLFNELFEEPNWHTWCAQTNTASLPLGGQPARPSVRDIKAAPPKSLVRCLEDS